MASGYALGYMLAMPVSRRSTDRIDVRLVLLCGSIVSGLATLGDLSIAGLDLYTSSLWSASGGPDEAIRARSAR